jgi:hypothetical protein
MFDINDSEILHAETENYEIREYSFNIEFGVYHSDSENDFPYLLLEEDYESDELVQSEHTFTKSKEVAFRLMEKRKRELTELSKTNT